ncbi:MAG: hypothetical protein ACYC0F_05180 [Rhodanobacter sp.]
MSSYVKWCVLNDGVSERVDHADAAEESAVIDRALIPITLGVRGRAAGGRDTPYLVDGQVGSKRAWLRLLDGEVVLADIGVCLHSRAASGLWADLHAGGVDDLAGLGMPSTVPWCAVRCYAPEGVLPAWFDSWTKTVAVALMRREGW